MNYYKHHIGDYDAATSHLTWLEDAAYRRLLCLYYRKEQPIPEDLGAACRLVRAVSKMERDAVENVLREFFHQGPDGWRHDRCDGEIEAAASKATANRTNGKNGGRPRKVGLQNETHEKPTGLFLGSHSEPTNNLSHKPLATSHTKAEAEAINPDGLLVASKPATPVCPHQEIIAAYHELLPSLTRVRDWTPERQTFLRKRWTEDPERQTVQWWRDFFVYVSESDFLMGRRCGPNGTFECDLEWLVRPKNFIKTLEGRYENRGQRSAA